MLIVLITGNMQQELIKDFQKDEVIMIFYQKILIRRKKYMIDLNLIRNPYSQKVNLQIQILDGKKTEVIVCKCF